MAKDLLSSAVLLVLLACSSTVALALQPERTGPDGGSPVTREGARPLAAQSLTQSLDPDTIVPGTSLACIPAVIFDHEWWRLFDLDDEFGLEGQFCVDDVDYAIEAIDGSYQEVTVRVDCLDDGLPFLRHLLTPAGTNTIPQPIVDLEFFNISLPPDTCCDSATQSMAVAMVSYDCVESGTCTHMFIGMNDLGQTAPTYISSPDCSILDPVDVAAIGFPNSHLILVVNGQDASPDDVPAGGGLGALLAVVGLLVASALALRKGGQT